VSIQVEVNHGDLIRDWYTVLMDRPLFEPDQWSELIRDP